MVLCLYFIAEHPKAQPKAFLKKPGIEPVILDLKFTALTHYTTATQI